MTVFEKIDFFVQGKKYKEALEFLSQLLVEDNKFDIYREIGKVYYQMGDYDKSLEYFLKIINSIEYIGKNEIYFEIAKIYEIKNQKQTAIEYLEKILVTSNNNDNLLIYALDHITKIYKSLQEYGKAIKILLKFQNKLPLSTNIDEILNDVYQEMYQRFPGNYDFGMDYNCLIQLYKEVLNANPVNKQVLCFLSQIYN